MEDHNVYMINRIFSKTNTKNIGDQAEQIAADYLIEHGLVLIDKNFNSRYGEIDLIMQDKNTIVFVEVRYRKSSTIMSALETIGPKKCARIIKTAESYIQSQKKYQDKNYRIDVITMSGELKQAHIDWIENAIQA